MLKDRVIYLNGEFISWDHGTVHLFSHSFARGSAIFEVISFHKTEKGAAVFRLDEHIKRLFRSAELLQMELPLSEEGMQEAVLATVRENRIADGFVKLVCYYHDVIFEILPPRKPLDVSIVAIDPVQDLGGKAFFPESLSACVSRWRKLHPETVPVEAKAAANYLNGIVARQDAGERGFDLAILLDTQGFVAEGGTESVFLVKDETLMTPSRGTVLQGITRKSLLEAAQRTGLKAREERLRSEALMEADEIFVSASPQKINPLYRIDDRVIPKVPGPVTKRLQILFEAICSGRDERFMDWLSPVDYLS